MNKKGQFFLIAAVVIAGIIITLGAINISTKQAAREEQPFYDLSKEIDYEASQLIDYGVSQKSSFSEINNSLVSFVSNYSAANPETDMIFIYGNKDSTVVLRYNKSPSGEIGISGTRTPQEVIVPTVPIWWPEGDNILVKLSEDFTLTFELKPGENFFIVLKKQAGEETFVAQK